MKLQLDGYALLNGVDIIFDKMEDEGMIIDTYFEDKKFIRTLNRSVNKYIAERFYAMLYDVQCFNKSNEKVMIT